MSATERLVLACAASTPLTDAVDRPIAIDSGIPSIRAPTAMARPLPGISASDGWGTHIPQRFRSAAPRLSNNQLPSEKSRAPPMNPVAVARIDPLSRDSETSSSVRTATRTPAPKPMTMAINRCGSRCVYPTSAPMNRPDPATSPIRPAKIQVAIQAPLDGARAIDAGFIGWLHRMRLDSEGDGRIILASPLRPASVASKCSC